MKKIIKKILETLLAAVGMICLAVFFVILLPIDYLKYRFSVYYRKTGKKYRLFGASGWGFAFYNEILKYDLPIRFVENPHDPSLECGRFAFEDILILEDVYSFSWDRESGTWQYAAQEEDEAQVLMTLEEYIDCEIKVANELTGQEMFKDAIVLMDGTCIGDPDELDKAKKEKRFLVYENNRPEVLKQFCDNHHRRE